MTSPAAATRAHLKWPADAAIAHTAQLATGPVAVRRLQLALASLWLLDAVLQFQSFMFGHGFAAMLKAAAAGNPVFIAGPVRWSAGLVDHHAVAANAAFATIQLLIGLGIAWRPTVRAALTLSVAWSVAVWWLGEGLGGLLAGTASPVNGAPGAVLLYALAAVLLWPRRDRQLAPAAAPSAHGGPVPVPAASDPFAAARCTGAGTARAIWLALWSGLAVLALLPATSAPRALGSMIGDMSAGQPSWLATVDTSLAAFASHHGPAVAVLLVVLLAVIAAGIYLPNPAVRAVLVLAVLVAAALAVAQGFGGILTGTGTDPDTGPLLALLALAYWPLRAGPPAGIRQAAAGQSGTSLRSGA